MRFLNCRIDEAEEKFNNKRIVFFGCGSWLKAVEYTDLMKLQHNFAYVVDNGKCNEAIIESCVLKIYKPDKLILEKNIVIVLTSPLYMYDMYLELQGMNLDDSIDCYAFPFMQKITKASCEMNELFREGEKKIPKIIHSFWFSGEKKPESYQKCIDTWPDNLPGYEIKEWTLDNYDWHKNAFLEKAIECKAWAYACDYARLDVLYRYGGIYLDMDVEVIKPFDDLLCNNAILSFSNNVFVDLAVVGSRKGNPLIKSLLNIYDFIDPPHEKKQFARYFQPALIRSVLANAGIKMNGSLQKVDEATVFPHEFFMPLDYVLFDENSFTDNTYCVHYDNFGWSYGKDDLREKKIQDNAKLWKLIQYDV